MFHKLTFLVFKQIRNFLHQRAVNVYRCVCHINDRHLTASARNETSEQMGVIRRGRFIDLQERVSVRRGIYDGHFADVCRTDQLTDTPITVIMRDQTVIFDRTI